MYIRLKKKSTEKAEPQKDNNNVKKTKNIFSASRSVKSRFEWKRARDIPRHDRKDVVRVCTYFFFVIHE